MPWDDVLNVTLFVALGPLRHIVIFKMLVPQCEGYINMQPQAKKTCQITEDECDTAQVVQHTIVHLTELAPALKHD